MKLVPIEQYSEHGLWKDAYDLTFDPELQTHMGVDPKLWANPPEFRTFLANVKELYDQKLLMGWAITKDDQYLGHVNLLKKGEWEIGTVIKDPKNWNLRYGIRATDHAMNWAFTEGQGDWVVAFAQGMQDTVAKILIKAGYRQFKYGGSNSMYVIDEQTFYQNRPRWSRK